MHKLQVTFCARFTNLLISVRVYTVSVFNVLKQFLFQRFCNDEFPTKFDVKHLYCTVGCGQRSPVIDLRSI